MKTLARISKSADTLRTLANADSGLGIELSKPRAASLVRIAGQLDAIVEQQRADNMADFQAERVREQDRMEAVRAEITQLAEKHGLAVKIVVPRKKRS